ncbi:MAG: mcp [Proteobacteria bacterium]|nr:mcp [Pseudomonadota bacterium]
MNFHAMTLKTRLTLLVLAAVLAVGAVAGYNLYVLRSSIRAEKVARLRDLVDSVASLVKNEVALEKAGKQTPEQTRGNVANHLNAIRFDKDNYFFVYDMKGALVWNPVRPKSSGEVMIDTKDSSGKLFIKEFVDVVRARGEGEVEYLRSRPGQKDEVPKLSYLKAVDDNWFVGTGIYIDDLDQLLWQKTAISLGIMALALLALGGFGILISRSVLRLLGGEPSEVQRIMRRIREGNLTPAATGKAPSGSVLADADEMRGALAELIRSIEQQAATIGDISSSTVDHAGQMEDNAHLEQQAASSMAAAVEELTVSINHIADNAHATRDQSDSSARNAKKGAAEVRVVVAHIQHIAETVNRADAAMKELAQASGSITEVLNVIRDIAGQTNLLALNAAIEAARAGEQGRGFAVVADEVRKLAERTTDATGQINGIIESIQGRVNGASEHLHSTVTEVEQGVTSVHSIGAVIGAIEQGAVEVAGLMDEMSVTLRQQGAAGNDMAQQVERVATMADDLFNAIHANRESARRLHEIAQGLRQGVARFEL